MQTRSFAIGTLLFPVFLVAIVFMSAQGGESTEQRTIAVVDRAPPGVADIFIGTLTADAPSMQLPGEPGAVGAAADAAPENQPGQPAYVVDRLPGEAPLDPLNQRVLERELDGYVILPADILETGEVMYRARNITNRLVIRDVRIAATTAVQTLRAGLVGVDPAVIQRLMERADVNTARITESGEEGGDAESTFWAAYFVAFLAYMVIAMYGHAVMRSVIQEKVTRISEILVSTMQASHLMAGKIVGVSAAALLQLAIWAAMVALVVSQSALLQERFGVSPTAMEAMRFEPGLALLLLAFFVLGFLLFAALFAALGAAMSSEQEAQPYQMLLMLPLLVPLLFLGPITNDPDGSIAVFLGVFPLTAPVAMPMRLAAAPPDTLIVSLAIGLLLLSTAAMSWLAGKIYRVGILATGKKPTVAELVRWVRAA